ncbi:hypothetical protein MRB53_012893 [Persea americana]|uniref:Uncharacterized protein n=1 Tax=Persea americana TaxID=3435 RepID=A0ACC2LZ22_PERAE|nr:hypothetical protein MRB53_012893 [Persea americana]
MGGCVDQKFVHVVHQDHGLMACDDDPTDSISFSDYSSSSSIASTSSDFTDDSTSPLALQSSLHPSPLRSTSPQFSSDGPLYELSELMAHLPIKRGLSKHYQGKSQSFTSLSNVRCTEDLAKKETPYSKKMKPCKSYGGFSDCQKSYTPKACTRIISKKASKSSLSCLQSKKSSFTCIRPPLPVPKSL